MIRKTRDNIGHHISTVDSLRTRLNSITKKSKITIEELNSPSKPKKLVLKVSKSMRTLPELTKINIVTPRNYRNNRFIQD